jgi:3-dehydroquinate synthase
MPQVFHPGDYPVWLGDLRNTFREWWGDGSRYTRIFLLADTHTHQHCAPIFFEKTGLPADTPALVIPAGETHKTLATCEQIWSAMFAAGLDRKSLVINLGGGVVGDMGGFCAATFKRGIDFVQVPTTLLAGTDAAIGGKLGVDFQALKNAIGVFRNPAAVLVDPVFFQTLSQRELHSGFAEVVKHACIGDPVLWQQIKGLTDLRSANWLDILAASIQVKVTVVQQDPFEQNIRALLNYGHTIGHAIESWFLQSPTPLTHGEAIAAGMLCETWIQKPNWPELPDFEQFTHYFFPHTQVPEAAFGDIWALMQQDKKNAAGAVRMALPGAVPLEMEVVQPTEEQVFASLRWYNTLQHS